MPITIAIAEDHDVVREGIIKVIVDDPANEVIAGAENGRALIDNIAALPAPPDVCIVDISMPVLNGFDTITELKKLYPGMKFLVLTMSNSEFSVIKMIKNGANGYLLKNSKPTQLLQAIKTVHTEGFYYSDIAAEKIFKIAAGYKKSQMLTDKEIHFLSLCCTDMKYEEIAETMYISVRTVQDHKDVISHKLDIHSRIGLALFAIQAGIVSMRGFYHLPKH